MITSRPGESWTTSRALPSERSCVRLAMSALGIRLPIRLVEQHEDEGGARAWRDGRRASRLGLHERGAAGGAESRAGGDGRPAARAARPRAGRREPPPALRAERQQGAGVTAAERAGDRLAGGRRADPLPVLRGGRKSTRLNSSHQLISDARFCLKKKINSVWNANGVARC